MGCSTAAAPETWGGLGGPPPIRLKPTPRGPGVLRTHSARRAHLCSSWSQAGSRCSLGLRSGAGAPCTRDCASGHTRCCRLTTCSIPSMLRPLWEHGAWHAPLHTQKAATHPHPRMRTTARQGPRTCKPYGNTHPQDTEPEHRWRGGVADRTQTHTNTHTLSLSSVSLRHSPGPSRGLKPKANTQKPKSPDKTRHAGDPQTGTHRVT